MLRILSIPFSALSYLWFGLVLIVFHPLQWISHKFWGYEKHKRVVDALEVSLLGSLVFVFSGARCLNRELIPEGKPLIFVANHQGIYDIMGMGWFLRKFHPKFVSKIELGKGLPSISYNLRHGGSVLIDRKDPRQALPELKKMGEYIQQHNRSAIIYPEGTRTKNGIPGTFASNGLKLLCRNAPDAFVVPITINNCWKVFRYGKFPLGMFNMITFTVHPAISVKETDFNTLFAETERKIKEGINPSLTLPKGEGTSID